MDWKENSNVSDSLRASVPSPILPSKLPNPEYIKYGPIRIPPSAFSGHSVFLFIKDKHQYNLASRAVVSAGANLVTQSPYLSDFVISDEPLTLSKPTEYRTRGAKLAAQAEINRLPQVILLANVQWVIEKPINPTRTMVVIDLARRLRPLSQPLSNIPTMNLNKMPIGYSMSPFNPNPTDLAATMAKIKSQLEGKPAEEINGPSGAGYCELCGENFVTASVHRTSQKHISNSSGSKWEEYDRFCALINMKFNK